MIARASVFVVQYNENIYHMTEVHITVTNKEKFIQIYRENITREGADRLLAFLCSEGSDFFTAPASARYHSAYEGGLCEHSLNVYDFCLLRWLR